MIRRDPQKIYLRRREMRKMRANALLEAVAQAQTSSLKVLTEAIENARCSELTEEQINAMLNDDNFVIEVLKMHRLFETVFERVAMIEEALDIGYQLDLDDGRPVLEKNNILSWWDGLEKTHEELMSLPDNPPPTSTAVTITRQEQLTDGLKAHNDNPHEFLNLVRSREIISQIAEMLYTVIDEGNYSMSIAIESFRDHFNRSVISTSEFEQARLRAEEDMVDLPPELVKAWQDLIADLDFHLAYFSSQLELLFGPRACWLLSHVQMDRLESMLNQLNADMNGANFYLSFAKDGRSRDFLKTLANRIEKLVSARKLTHPPGTEELEHCITEIQQDKRALESAIRTKKKRF